MAKCPLRKQEHFLKAYSTQKLGSEGNFDRGKHVSDRRFDHATWNTNMITQQLRHYSR